MQGVKKVIALDDQRLHWETSFSGKPEAWNATITDLTPDECCVGKLASDLRRFKEYIEEHDKDSGGRPLNSR